LYDVAKNKEHSGSLRNSDLFLGGPSARTGHERTRRSGPAEPLQLLLTKRLWGRSPSSGKRVITTGTPPRLHRCTRKMRPT